MRGEIWLANSTLGSEIKPAQGPTRLPNAQEPSLAPPMTTGSRLAPFRIAITHGGKKGLILLDQMRAVDKVRLAKKLGAVSLKTLTSALTTLQELFAE